MRPYPDLGVIPTSRSRQLKAALVSAPFLLITPLVLMDPEVPQGERWFLCSFTLFLMYALIRRSISKRTFQGGVVTIPGLFKAQRAPYESLTGYDIRLVKQRYGEVESVQLFTDDQRSLVILQGEVSAEDYQRVKRWAEEHLTQVFWP